MNVEFEEFDSAEDLFNGRMPDEIIEKYAISRSVTPPAYTK